MDGEYFAILFHPRHIDWLSGLFLDEHFQQCQY
jgi:hypothetical protein